jgi:hypothetical protein
MDKFPNTEIWRLTAFAFAVVSFVSVTVYFIATTIY